MASLFDAFSTQPATDAATDKTNNLNQALREAQSGLNTGINNANGYFGQASNTYGQALSPWSALAGKAGTGFDQYSTLIGNALGANGPGGNAAATAAFNSNPGLQWSLNQGLDQIDRRAASRGMLGSGNTNVDTINYANGVGAQGWNQYIQNLMGAMSPFTQLSGAAAAGQSGVLQNQAGMYQNQAGMNYGYGRDLAGYGYQNKSAIGDTQAAADMSAYNASKNLWGAIGSLGGSALNLAGAGSAGGFGNFGSMFGGAAKNASPGFSMNGTGGLY